MSMWLATVSGCAAGFVLWRLKPLMRPRFIRSKMELNEAMLSFSTLDSLPDDAAREVALRRIGLDLIRIGLMALALSVCALALLAWPILFPPFNLSDLAVQTLSFLGTWGLLQRVFSSIS